MQTNKVNANEREHFGSRLGFILISAGCAIGLGNVWRFPAIVSQYGGAAFILIYLVFLLIFGLPIMTMEFAVGRASKKSIIGSFSSLEKKGTKWHLFGGVGLVGNYVLMMFYVPVTAWMFIYFFKFVVGDFYHGQPTADAVGQYSAILSNPLLMIGVVAIVVLLGIFVCSLGIKKGLEKVNKTMMLCLLAIIVVLAVYVCTLDGAGEGLKYYLVPNFNNLLYDAEGNFILAQTVFAALSQAFFTLSIGIGSMAIFGSYIKDDRTLLGEAVSIASLDTAVAFIAGLIVIPATFVYKFDDAQIGGPGLIFETLPNIFNNMEGGRILGAFFFLFMIFAAMSTVTAVFENIIACGIDKWGWSRKKSCLINCALIFVLTLPCILGFSVWSGFTPFGPKSTIMDLEDFIVSSNLLPLGSLVYLLFCVWDSKGWGWNEYYREVNKGKGLKVPQWLKFYCKYILPVMLVILYVLGIISKFFPAFLGG